MCPEGKNNNKSGNYEYLQYNGAKNVTREKFKKQCGTASHTSYIRHITKSYPQLKYARTLKSDFCLHTARTFGQFQHALLITLSPKVFVPMNQVYVSLTTKSLQYSQRHVYTGTTVRILRHVVSNSTVVRRVQLQNSR